MHDVLNWVGQGTMVALATFALLRALDKSRAGARCTLCWTAILAILVLPFLSLARWTATAQPQASLDSPLATGAIIALPAGWWTMLSTVVALWLLWVSVFSVRSTCALLAVRAARRRCRQFPSEVESALHHWSIAKCGGRRTRLALSAEAGSAAVLGCGSPIIAVAPWLVDHLTAEELDRVVMHEWAHVQRRDDFLNVVQLGIRAVAGWHPAIWWLNRQLVIEREVACDERVVGLTGSPKAYATSLTRVASLASIARTHVMAVGALSSSALRMRIVRIVSRSRRLSPRMSAAAVMAASALLAVVSVNLGGVRLIGVATPIRTVDQVTNVVAANVLTPVETPRAAQAGTGARSRPRSIPSQRDEIPLLALGSPTHLSVEQVVPQMGERVSEQIVEPVGESALMAAPLPANTGTLGLAPSGLVPGPGTHQTATITRPLSPWARAANAGTAIGKGSQKAGVATATFFNRVGQKIGRSF